MNSFSVILSDIFSRPLHGAGFTMAVNRRSLIVVFMLGIISGSFLVSAEKVSQMNSLFVYHLNGTKHCEPDSGIGSATMGQQLTNAGIKIISMHKGFDGREGIAVCGSPTGEINI